MAQSKNFNSPLFSTNPMSENSPMTNLAHNLGNTNISSIPARRKLTLSEDSPLGAPMMVSPLGNVNGDRLLKCSLQFSNGNTLSPISARKTIVPRRLSHMGNENYNPMQTSPLKPAISPSKFQAVRQVTAGGKVRQPLEDHDPNSQDSGFCPSSDDSKSLSSSSSSTDFCFVQPSGFAPRRSVADSPRRSSLSLSSNESDDGFIDYLSPLQDEEAQLPPEMGGLFKDPIINHGLSTADSSHLLSFKRCIAENISPMSPLVEEQSPVTVTSGGTLTGSKRRLSSNLMDLTPVSKRHKGQPLSEVNALVSPPRQPSPTQHTLFQYGFKRLKEPRPLLGHSISLEEPVMTPHRPKFRHCLSESEAVIKRALLRSSEEDLIGDFSRTFALPLVSGSHQDLKSISPTTLARLINGEFADTIESFHIVDCRYPYEYEGGHIKGALNIYTKDQAMKEFLENKPPALESPPHSKRHIVVFHCEFSSERGPGLSRFLRSKDRENNAYPMLHYPELYLLEGGYKAFFSAHSELCEPCAYRKMVDADKEQLHHFRAKSKTWSGDKSSRTIKRSASFKRLGL